MSVCFNNLGNGFSQGQVTLYKMRSFNIVPFRQGSLALEINNVGYLSAR